MGQANRKRLAVCRCGSGMPAGECCYTRNGWFKKAAVVDLTKTGAMGSHGKCYLRDVGTCSDKISGEHLVSEGVLKVLADEHIEIGGLPYLKGEKKRLPFSALTANALCQAHNSALSPLDAAGAFLFGAIQKCGTTAVGKNQHFLLSGHDFERWMFRTFAVMAVSGNFAIDGVSIEQAKNVRLPFSDLLQKPEMWKRPLGMYFTSTLNTKFTAKAEFNLVPLISRDSGELIGIHADVTGMLIGLVGAPHDISDTIFKDAIYRPGRFIFRLGRCEHTIQFSWEDSEQHADIAFTWES